MTVDIRAFDPQDYDAVVALWRDAPGVMLRAVDEREPLVSYLDRNPGLSFVAIDDERIVGAVLCGTDSRRGYLQHLAVARSHQRRGIGRRLAERCTDALAHRGIDKCHLMVVITNADARAFWTRLGWTTRDDILVMSHTASGLATA